MYSFSYSHGARFWLCITLFACMSVVHAHDRSSPTQELSHGYAMLHDALKRLQHLDKVLLVKNESAPVRLVIRQLADTSDRLDESLQQLAETDPAIDLKDQGLTRFELEKRQSLMLDRGLSLGMPLLGKTGVEMERTALLSLSAAVNQQRYLIKVMLPDEPDPKREQWLQTAKLELDGVYEAMVELLESAYFCVADTQKR